jgi:hypothetical protein
MDPRGYMIASSSPALVARRERTHAIGARIYAPTCAIGGATSGSICVARRDASRATSPGFEWSSGVASVSASLTGGTYGAISSCSVRDACVGRVCVGATLAFAKPGQPLVQSFDACYARTVIAGSTSEARRAGIQQATIPIAAIITATPMNVRGSCGATPKSNPRMTPAAK